MLSPLRQAAERKRILVEILGVDQWADYENAVKNQLGEIAGQIAIFVHDIRRADDEISREPQLLKELDNVTKSFDEAQAKLDSVSAQYDGIGEYDGLVAATTRKPDATGAPYRFAPCRYAGGRGRDRAAE